MDKKKHSVLLVDDVVTNLRMLINILKSEYILYTAKNGEEALRVAREKRPDIILLDVLMPVMDGYATITALKLNPDTVNIPVVFITGLNSEMDEEKALELGAADFIVKPFNPTLVKLRVRNQLQAKSHLQAIEDLRNQVMLGNILDGVEALITVVDPDTNKILFLNSNNREFYNLDDDGVGQLCHKVLQGLDEPCEGCPYQKLREEPGRTFVWEHKDRINGSILRKTARLIDWVGGKKAHLEYALDVTHFKQMEAEIEKSHLDPLTEVYTRRFFEETIKRLIDTLPNADGLLSLMMIDIDFFKKYNDTYGHLQGDECLKIVAATLKSCFTRGDDFIARFGGEEFVVVLPDTNEHGARVVADKMLRTMFHRSIPHEKSDVADCVTVSIGVVTSHVRQTQSRDDYLKLADEMLYQSKEGGRNRYTFAMLP